MAKEKINSFIEKIVFYQKILFFLVVIALVVGYSI